MDLIGACAVAVFPPVSDTGPEPIAEIGETTIWTAVLNEPWKLDIDAFVIPTGPKGDLEGALAETLRTVVGSDWLVIERRYSQALSKTARFDPDTPLVVEVNVKATKARFFIFATGVSGKDSRAADATEAIVALARRHKISNLGIPLLGSGRAKVASSEETAAAMLRALVRTVGRSSLKNVYITTLSSGAFKRLGSLASEIGASKPQPRSASRQGRTMAPTRARPSAKGATEPPSQPIESTRSAAETAPEQKTQQPWQTTEKSSQESSFRPATALVEELLATHDAVLDAAAWQLIAFAGHIASVRRQHNADGKLLTTSTLLFAMVEQGRRADDGPLAAPLRLLASAVTARAEGPYSSQLSRFLGDKPLNRDFGEVEKVATMTPNVKTVLIRAVAIQREAGTKAVGTAALTLALIESHGEFAKQLGVMGLTRGDLQGELASGLKGLLRPPELPPPAQPVALANFWTDNPSASVEDYLDVKKEVEAFARLAANKEIDPPLSIGIFGEWGSGKTFFMERMYDRVAYITSENSDYQTTGKFHSGVVQIRFNAWHYIETNLWASLVEFIFFELDRWLTAHKTPRGKIDALFDQLATSKQLRLDAVRDLLASRRSLYDARAELTTARENYDKAVKKHAIASPADVLSSVWDEVVERASQDEKIKTAAADLGLQHLSESKAGLRALVDDTRGQGTRARLLGQSLLARLGSPVAVVLSVLVILAAPLAVEWLRYAIVEACDLPWLKDFNSGVLAFTSFVGAVTLTGRVLLNRGIAGLNAIDRFRAKLDGRIAEKTKVDRERLEATEKEVSRHQQAVSEAEHRVASATNLAAAAELEYANDTSRGRLNKFIREKVADGSYAKHLGIIATIRKDFDQLASIMSAEALSDNAKDELTAARELYESKLEALIKIYDAEKTGLLKKDELTDLRKVPEESKFPFFDRIVLYIDDLDRCPPEKVTEVLQAIHMLLFFPLFVVVVAVDARWVARSLESEFSYLLREADARTPPKPPDGAKPDNAAKPVEARPLSGAETATATAQDYLEKIFQIPFWVRRMDDAASKKFVKGLATREVKAETGTRTVVSGPPPTDGEPITPPPGDKPPVTPNGDAPDTSLPVPPNEPPQGLKPVDSEIPKVGALEVASLTEDEIGLLEEFAPFIGGSPRRAKRFVNLYHLLRASIGSVPRAGSDIVLHRHALVAALAVVTGAPHSASSFFNALQPRAGGWHPSLDEIVLDPAKSGGAATDANLRGILERLVEITSAGTHNGKRPVSNGPDLTQALSKLSDTVRRYSFEMVK